MNGALFWSKDMRKVMFKLRILRKSAEHKIYPYELIKDISESRWASKFYKSKGEIKNDVYNTINMLEKSGYLKPTGSAKSTSKTYYVITNKGRNALKSARVIFAAGMKEVSKILR